MTSRSLNGSNSAAGSIPQRIIFGRSSAMREVQQSVERVAGTSVPVLILGERGTGKEVIGREIHRLSPWRSAAFVKASGNEATASLFRSQMSEADNTSRPSWESTPAASPDPSVCTLFIDEVGELAPHLQLKLVEFFQGSSLNHSNEESNSFQHARVICSSSRNLEDDVAAGFFRFELFYRINVVTIDVPSLRDRRGDIPDLAEYIFESSCRLRDRACNPLSTDILRLFCEYDWPGNIRELENCVRSYVDAEGDAAVVEALVSERGRGARGKPIGSSEGTMPLRTYTRQLVKQAERDMILQVLHQHRWNRKETAKALQVSYQTLLHKLKQAGLSKKFRREPEVADQQIPDRQLP